MQWAENGKIQISRNFAIGAAAIIIGLALVAMFLIGMLVAGDAETENTANPTPTVLADRQDTETEEPTRNPQTASKSNYSTCLARTWRALSLDVRNAEFTPWEERDITKDVWPLIELRHVDYIGEHCRYLAPPPPSSSSATCIPRELQTFYRRHIPEGADNDNFRTIAAEYALTVCQPSAER